jgi:hypothetical protein
MRVAGLVLLVFVYCLVATLLPDVPVGVDGAIGTVAVFAVVLGVARVGDEPFAAWLILFGAVLIAATLDVAHQNIAATVPEAVACACAGALFARGMALPALVLTLPLIVAVIDGVSVASGGAPLSNGVGSSDAFSLDIPAWGGGTALQVGLADPVFAAVFWWWAHRFGLRERWTTAAMLVAVGVAVVLVISAEVTIPVLPLLAAAFYLPNLDRLGAVLKMEAGPRPPTPTA